MTGARTLPISEVFTTLQGEGPAAGRPATFVRLGGCNLACAWCDTPYTWDAKGYDLRAELVPVTATDVVARLDAPLVIVTGGEPLLHQGNPAWDEMLHGIRRQGREVHIETNGTRAPSLTTAGVVNLAVVSPKLGHAHAETRTGQRPIVPEVLRGWAERAEVGRAILKLVVQTDGDCASALRLAESTGWPRSAVWLMPEGRTREELADRWPMVATFAADNGVNATHRLHVLAWGEKRGH